MPIASFVSALAALGGTGMAMVKGLRDDKQSRYPPEYLMMKDMMKMARKGYPMGMMNMGMMGMYNPYQFPMYQPQQFSMIPVQPQMPMMYQQQPMYQPYPMYQQQPIPQQPVMLPTQSMMGTPQLQSDIICQMLQQQLQMQIQQQQILNQLNEDMRKRMLMAQYQPYVQEMIHPRTFIVPNTIPLQTTGPIWEDDTGKQAVYPPPQHMPIPLVMAPEPIAISQQAPRWEENPNIPKNYVGNKW